MIPFARSFAQDNRIAQPGSPRSERMDRPPSISGIEQALIAQLPAHIAVFDCEMRYVAVSQRFLSDMALLFATKVFTPAEGEMNPWFSKPHDATIRVRTASS
jgi:hypothetical protein